MTNENLAAVERIFREFAHRESETVFDVYDPEIVWDTREIGDGLADLRGVYHGEEGVRTWWRQWLDAWEAIEFVEAFHETHGNQVISTWKQRNRGRGSGVEVDMESGIIWTFQSGRIVRAAIFISAADAHRAAGLAV